MFYHLAKYVRVLRKLSVIAHVELQYAYCIFVFFRELASENANFTSEYTVKDLFRALPPLLFRKIVQYSVDDSRSWRLSRYRISIGALLSDLP